MKPGADFSEDADKVDQYTACDPVFVKQQGPTKGLSHIRFHDYQPVFEASSLPNVAIFREQVAAFREMLQEATPGQSQANDIDFLMAVGELFTLVVYAQLLLEAVAIDAVDDALVDRIFDVFVRDFAQHATTLHGKPTTTPEQAAYCLRMLKRPLADAERFQQVWDEHVFAQRDVYEMRP